MEFETYESAEQLLTRLPDDPGMSCILLDIKMPGVGGPELQNRLNAVGSSYGPLWGSSIPANSAGREFKTVGDIVLLVEKLVAAKGST